jgi:hypothetical protein
MLMLSFFPKSEDAKRAVSNQKIKIKFEIDLDNPSCGVTESKYKMLPAPYEVQIFDEPLYLQVRFMRFSVENISIC